ncbi:MAG: hypothetical protein FJY34_03895 [Betaproteobacteria bacterium]|nr:hypothetical protein [Betaproteobacteria bacterium]
MPAEPPTDNAAWVDIDLPQPAQDVAEYLRDVERLLRLNPYLEIRRFEKAPQGFALEALNEMNGCAVSQRLTFDAAGLRGYVLRYDTGLKQTTEVAVEPHRAGSRLRIRETYRPPADDAELAQVDRSLTPWGQSIRRHFMGLARWGRLPGYRRWRERVWLGMKPRERRVTRLIVWATLVEFFVFVAAVFLYLG